MSQDLETRYEKLRTQAQKLQRELDRAVGESQAIRKQLREEFEVDSLEDAEKLLTKLERLARKAEAEFEKAVADYEQRFSDLVG